ncbi:DJ-1/PfpI family protein [Saccharothrix syringae]|uniref:DJ-1/PfpI family protein n=1 Tax=Saccharothrix syringae TaxID=103733 RepID=A0A5Q0H1R3_SACSY|nr:DJ-1/PfpI family protein [Saccharothrix syringae]QFZ19794.1 DJ-1/PfpI family protein [Saccharothrix syringae]
MLAQVVLFDGFDPLDVIAPYEVLALGATLTDDPLEVELVTAEGPREVPSGLAAVSLRATARLDPARADLVVVPGAAGTLADGEPDEGSVLGRLGRAARGELAGLLAEALERRDVLVATVCGGSVLLAMAGLIRGRSATGHRLGLGALAGAGVRALDARVVDDGDLVSSSSVTSGLDLGLYLLERLVGPRVAVEVERFTAHERRGTVWRPVGAEPLVTTGPGTGGPARR